MTNEEEILAEILRLEYSLAPDTIHEIEVINLQRVEDGWTADVILDSCGVIPDCKYPDNILGG